jgi:hypothetical protein
MKKQASLYVIALIAIALLSAFLFLKNNKNIPLLVNEGYEVSQPHYGPLIQLKDIELSFYGNIANANLSLDNAQNITKLQRVVLYDKNLSALPLGAEITMVKKEDNKTKLIILLPFGTNTELLSNKASVIVSEEIAAKRLPLSALIEEDQKLFVWRLGNGANIDLDESEETKLNSKLEKVHLSGVQKNDRYFVEIGNIISSKDLIVLNPDKNINTEKKYTLNVTEFEAPLHNPIKQAWVNLELKKIADQRAKDKQDYLDCIERNRPKLEGGEMSNKDGNSSSSCAANFDPSDPFMIFENLIHEMSE